METNLSYAIAKSKEDWHAIRSQGLGGSDIGVVLGLNDFKTPYQLWLEKTGQIEIEDISDKVAIQVGNSLEQLVADIFTQETGIEVQKDNKTHFHKDYPFLLANIDRKIVGERALLECKTTSVFNKKSWEGDDIPASYFMQVQHYLNVLDYDFAYIAVIVGNHEFIYKKIERDQELIELYTKRVEKFWNENILKKIPPDIDGSIETNQYLSQLFYDQPESKIDLSADHIKLVKEIVSLKEAQKHINDNLKTKENMLKHYLGQQEATTGYGLGIKVSYKAQSRTSIDTKKLKAERPDIFEQYSKTSKFKVLRITEEKENGDSRED